MRLSARHRVGLIMDERVHTAAAHELARDVLHGLLAAKASHAVIVAFDAEPIGTVALSALLPADPTIPVTRLMRPTLLWISEHESVAIAVRVMAMSSADFLLVHDDARKIVGCLGTRNLIGLGMGMDSVELGG